MKGWPVVSFLLLVALIVCIVTRPSGPIVDAGRDSHIDSSKAVQAAAESALAHADSAIAQDRRDSTVQQLTDSATDLGHRLDSLDALAAKLARANRARRDSLNDARMKEQASSQADSMTGNLPAFNPDTMTPTIATDSALACESRYSQRLIQIRQLTDAVEKCQVKRNQLQASLVGVRDTLKQTQGFLAESDRLLVKERDRPRPCRVNLLVASVGCGKAMGGVAVISFLGGLIAGH